MKRLILMRHAKSDWADAGLADFDRPLASRGERAAPVMGRFLADNGWRPDLALCSAAVRTRETWSLVAAALIADAGDPAPPVDYLPALYEAAPQQVIDVIRQSGGQSQTLCVVGHHPGIDGATLLLSGTGDRKAMDRLRVKFPTGAVALIQINLDNWAALDTGMGELVRFATPKEIAAD